MAETAETEPKPEKIGSDKNTAITTRSQSESSTDSESIGDWDEDEDSFDNKAALSDSKTFEELSADKVKTKTTRNKEKITEKNAEIQKIAKNVGKIAKNAETPLRSPIICVLGHVDTGKTKLLDRMRQTSVQSHEVGGITQQIGASFFPKSFLESITAPLNSREAIQAASQFSELSNTSEKTAPKTTQNDTKTGKIGRKADKTKKSPKTYQNDGETAQIDRKTAPKIWNCRLPGLLVIDTPGHESFTNLRKRGSSLCDMAVLVVDIMHGVEPQTAESVQLLRKNKTPFVVALNKLDRLFAWRPTDGAPFAVAMAAQGDAQRNEFRRRLGDAVAQVAALGLNAALFCENPDSRAFASVVPTSALTGEGVPDLLRLLADCWFIIF